MKATSRKKPYIKRSRAITRPLRDNLIWTGQRIASGSSETVILFGEAENPALKESARIIINGGRQVQYKNLQTQAI